MIFCTAIATKRARKLGLFPRPRHVRRQAPGDVSGTGGTYSARLPHAGKGQAMSLRVEATDSGGRIDQTILRAYFGA
jgi:hypothetical protein